MEAIDLSRWYVDLAPFADQCEYRECAHIDEPDCAVKRAVERGLIADWRYRNYCGILLGTTGREGRLIEQNES
jgi:ribosome biogenesis GTPase